MIFSNMRRHSSFPYTPMSELVVSWLDKEQAYVARKFGTNQKANLKRYSLSHESSFGGVADMRWKRLQDARATAQPLRAAQDAGKLASSCCSLWATILAFDRRSDVQAHRTALEIAREHLEENGFAEAKRRIDHEDFGETPVGLGLTYLELYIRQRGLAQKFRLACLGRAEQIFADATSVMALQFQETLAQTDALPAPGQSSGNLGLWLPDGTN
jgi:hypothetical protein